jgi:effector-binding domain-containing protein
MKIVKSILIIVVAIIAILLVVTAFLPKERTFSQSINIEKSPRLIFAQLNSMKNWENWSPFQEADPEMTSEYSGPDFGVGSRQDWKSKVNGDGYMVIVESIGNEKVVYDLDLGMGAIYPNWFTLERNPEAVIVTWGVEMKDLSYPMGRLMMTIFSGQMDKVFVKGLENLKKYLNEQPADCYTGEIEVVDVPSRLVLATSKTVITSGIEVFLQQSFGALTQVAKSNKLQIVGFPIAIYEGDETSVEWGVTAVLPVSSVPLKLPEGIVKMELPQTKAVCVIHSGAYNTVGDTYYKLIDQIMVNGMEITGDSWEEYITNPELYKDSMQLQTKICFPIK